MAILLRRPHQGDIADLVAIENAAFPGDRLSRRSLRRLLLSPSAATILADWEGRVAGYAVVLFRRGTKAARLYSIAVAPGFTGRRIGTRLLEAAEEAVRARGGTLMRLEVRADNRTAIALYGKAGYRLSGRKSGYYEDGEDALKMEKKLVETGR